MAILANGQTRTEFRKEKRRQLRAAEDAFKELMLGSAYLPREAYEALKIADERLEFAAKLCRRTWG